MAKCTDEIIGKIIESIPDECPLELSHVQVHIGSAIEAREQNDYHQYVHDIDLAGRILLAMAHDVTKWGGAVEHDEVC